MPKNLYSVDASSVMDQVTVYFFLQNEENVLGRQEMLKKKKDIWWFQLWSRYCSTQFIVTYSTLSLFKIFHF